MDRILRACKYGLLAFTTVLLVNFLLIFMNGLEDLVYFICGATIMLNVGIIIRGDSYENKNYKR